MTKPIRRIHNLLLRLSVSLLLLSGTEVVIRLIGWVTPAVTDFRTYHEVLMELTGFDETDKLLIADSELFWRLRPSVSGMRWYPDLWVDNRSNSHGMRDPERQLAKPKDSLRIFSLGGSCTYGTGVRMADSYPQLLEAMLARHLHDRTVEVWNGGVPGWSSDQGQIYLARWASRIEPDIVTISFGINDGAHWVIGHHQERGHSRCRTDRSARVLLNSWHARLNRILSHSALYRTLKHFAPERLPVVANGTAGSARVPMREFDENIRNMIAYTRSLGAVPVLILWPIRWQLEPMSPGTALLERTPYQNTLTRLGAELDVPVLDLVTRLAGKEAVFVDSVHLGTAGNQVVAAELATLLYETGLLPVPAPLGKSVRTPDYER